MLPSIQQNKIVTAFLPGLDHPSAVIRIRLPASGLPGAHLAVLDAALATQIRGHVATNHPDWLDARQTEAWLLAVLAHLHRLTGMPTLPGARLEVLPDAGTDWYEACLLHPVLGPQHSAVNYALHCLVQMLQAETTRVDTLAADLVPKVLQRFRQQAPGSSTTTLLLETAMHLDIPWQHLSHNVFQFGLGRRSRLLDGSFTDRTPNIATRLARNKLAMAHVLRSAGVPVPRHYPANTVQEALQRAQGLGFPVVIKPLEQDGGAGVSPDLHNVEAVRGAWQRASRFGPQVLVEEHCQGEDYRIYVLNGQVRGVYHRVCAQVTGDGRHTVAALIDSLNEDPRRQPEARRWHQVEPDADMDELLREQGQHRKSVPAAGLRVRLRRTPNVMTGGEAALVPLDQVHPENLQLALRATELMRLDIAGIDFLSPDIGRSWRSTGAVICEINAQPLFPPALAETILREVVVGNGRIPVMVLVDNRAEIPWLTALGAALAAKGRRLGVARETQITRGDEVVAQGSFDAPHGAQILLRDPGVDVAVLCVSDARMLRNGLPVDRCNLVLLSGTDGFVGDLPALASELSTRAAAVWIDASSPLWTQAPPLARAPKRVDEAELGQKLLKLLR